MQNFSRYTISICIVAAMLSGCGARNNAAALPGAMPQSADTSSYHVLYAFPHRAFPNTNLIDVKGTLYGTTPVGGSSGNGIVYSVTTKGVEKILHSFKAHADGVEPEGSLINVNGVLYGTTFYGGISGSACTDKNGCGIVYNITTSGVEKVLYNFAGGSDGAHPMGRLLDVGGVLYGTTYQGGGSGCSVHGRTGQGCGTVYSITTTGQENVIYSFGGRADGWFPKAGLIEVNGAFYGTTYLGGADAEGTVFRLSMSGVKKVLHNFGAGADGLNPQAPLLDVNGTLYGTTLNGGAYSIGHGTVFSISTKGAEQVLHSFAGAPDGDDPYSGLINVNGTLYGTTVSGGTGCGNYGCGTIYAISASGNENVIYSFAGGTDGSGPQAPLLNANGTLYGTTAGGGSGNGFGTVFAFTPSRR